MRILLDYSWPGNVRELANVIEYAVAVAERETILPEDLPEEILKSSGGMRCGAKRLNRDLNGRTRNKVASSAGGDPEAMRFLEALEKHHWKRADAARALGLSRSTLWRRMRELQL